jgi:hypothetical protein
MDVHVRPSRTMDVHVRPSRTMDVHVRRLPYDPTDVHVQRTWWFDDQASHTP